MIEFGVSLNDLILNFMKKNGVNVVLELDLCDDSVRYRLTMQKENGMRLSREILLDDLQVCKYNGFTMTTKHGEIIIHTLHEMLEELKEKELEND